MLLGGSVRKFIYSGKNLKKRKSFGVTRIDGVRVSNENLYFGFSLVFFGFVSLLSLLLHLLSPSPSTSPGKCMTEERDLLRSYYYSFMHCSYIILPCICQRSLMNFMSL